MGNGMGEIGWIANRGEACQSLVGRQEPLRGSRGSDHLIASVPERRNTRRGYIDANGLKLLIAQAIQEQSFGRAADRIDLAIVVFEHRDDIVGAEAFAFGVRDQS